MKNYTKKFIFAKAIYPGDRFKMGGFLYSVRSVLRTEDSHVELTCYPVYDQMSTTTVMLNSLQLIKIYQVEIVPNR